FLLKPETEHGAAEPLFSDHVAPPHLERIRRARPDVRYVNERVELVLPEPRLARPHFRKGAVHLALRDTGRERSSVGPSDRMQRPRLVQDVLHAGAEDRADADAERVPE